MFPSADIIWRVLSACSLLLLSVLPLIVMQVAVNLAVLLAVYPLQILIVHLYSTLPFSWIPFHVQQYLLLLWVTLPSAFKYHQ